MSTILDALKRVEEQIRSEAEQRAGDGLPGHPDPSKTRADAPMQAKNGASGDADEVAQVYTGILNMLARIQEQVRTGKDEARAEARNAHAELAKTMATLQNDFIRQREAIQKEFQKRDTEHGATNARLAESQTQTESLKKMIGEFKAAGAELARAVTTLQSELQRQREAMQIESQKRDTERAAGNAKLSEAQSQADGLKKTQSEHKSTSTELSKALAALQSEFIYQRDGVQKEFKKRDAERTAGNAKLAENASQTEALKRLIAEAKAGNGELSKALTALQNDFTRQREAIQKEFQKQNIERDGLGAKLAETQSQVGALKKTIAETGAAGSELAKAVTLLQNDAVRQRDAIVKEFQKRDADRNAGNTKLSELQSQTDTLKKVLAETGAGCADLAKAVGLLQSDAVRQRDAIIKEFRRCDTEQAAGNTRLAESQSETEALRQALAQSKEGQDALVQSFAAVRNDFAGQIEALLGELQKRDVGIDAGSAKMAELETQTETLKATLQAGLAGTENSYGLLSQAVAALKAEFSQQVVSIQRELQERSIEPKTGESKPAEQAPLNDSVNALLAETSEKHAALAQSLTTLKNDFSNQMESLRKDLERRSAAPESQTLEVAGPTPEQDSLAALLAETRENHAALAQTIGALQADLALQREALEQESRKREADRAAGEAALATVQSQTEALQQLVGKCENAVADALASGLLATGTASEASARQEPFQTAAESASGDGKVRTRLDKDEAVKLHSAARDAYSRGDLLEALQLLDRIDAAFPRNKSVLHNRAQCLIGLGRNDEARSLCDFLVSTLNHAPAEELKRLIPD